jgi:hypothetical protein
MTIAKMMKDRAALTAEIDAVPADVSTDKKFREIYERRWALERVVLSCTTLTLDELRSQLRILAARARDGADVADDLTRLSA